MPRRRTRVNKSYRRIFRDRMFLSGRGGEWSRLMRDNMATMCLEDATKATMAAMGFEGKEKELELEATAQEGGADPSLEERESLRNPKLAAFEDAVAGLPDRASISVETDWIRAHPAMSRMSRSSDKKPVILTAADVLRPPHGKAPSKSAVRSLQHWANYPARFFEKMATDDKKKQKAEGGEVQVEDVGIEEIRRLLESLTWKE